MSKRRVRLSTSELDRPSLLMAGDSLAVGNRRDDLETYELLFGSVASAQTAAFTFAVDFAWDFTSLFRPIAVRGPLVVVHAAVNPQLSERRDGVLACLNVRTGSWEELGRGEFTVAAASPNGRWIGWQDEDQLSVIDLDSRRTSFQVSASAWRLALSSELIAAISGMELTVFSFDGTLVARSPLPEQPSWLFRCPDGFLSVSISGRLERWSREGLRPLPSLPFQLLDSNHLKLELICLGTQRLLSFDPIARTAADLGPHGDSDRLSVDFYERRLAQLGDRARHATIRSF
ncbi:MAG: hypothetical protein GQE15_32200 [Archangiaceae bacterium]|nr:hypothetical protein [Archangiaceae bacterium]